MKILDSEINLWFAYPNLISDAELLQKYFMILSEEERERQGKFYFAKHRHQYLITRALVRNVLSLYFPKIAPKNWSFDKNKFGKPWISNPGVPINLHFNLSHSEQIIVMAVALNPMLGVDVENIYRETAIMEIAKAYFSKTEIDFLAAQPLKNRQTNFFELWTLKEAYIKAKGQGLSLPLNQCSFSFPQADRIKVNFFPEYIDQPDNWQFWQFKPSPDAVAAAAIYSTSKINYEISMYEMRSLDDDILLREVRSLESQLTDSVKDMKSAQGLK